MPMQSMQYGVVPAFITGGLLAAIRSYYFFRVGLRFHRLLEDPHLNSRRVYKFAEPYDVELASRVGRVWDDDENPDPQVSW